MELQLALSLSSSSSFSSSSTKKFDLNNENVEEKEMIILMEDLKRRKQEDDVNGDEEVEFHHVPQTLPLLFSNKCNQQHEDVVVVDDMNEVQSTLFFINHK